MFNNLPIRYKMLLMVMMPMLLAIFFTVKGLSQSYKTYTTMEQASSLGTVAVAASELVHELQKERGASAGYLGSKGTKFGAELDNQRAQTDKALSNYRGVVAGLSKDAVSGDLSSLLSTLKGSLSRLSSIRRGVTAQTLSTPEAIGFYTGSNAKLLQISSLMSTLVEDAALGNRVSAYLYLLQSKERAGIERAVLSGVFAQGQFSSAAFQKFVTLLAEQKTYMQVFRDYASADVERSLDRIVSGQGVSEVQRMRSVALGQQQGLSVDATYWFRMATERINKLKEAENVLAGQVVDYIQLEKQAAFNAFLWLAILAASAVGITVAVVGYLLNRIGWQIRSLSEAMVRVREKSDLTSRAQSGGQDELGVLAQDFNGMVEALSSLASSVNSASRDLSGMVSQMQAVSTEVNDEVQSGLLQTDQVAAAVNEMEASVQEVAGNCSATADKSKEAHTAATQGENLVNSANQVMHRLSDEIAESMQVIEQVAADSDEIGSILDVINGVAEQTNLLALNAAIEAARAGEQGRGFAVVADEVRTLAHKTAQSTSRIQEMIEQLQGRSRQAVSAMQDSQQCASETVSGFEEILGQLRNITAQFGQVNDMNLQVAAATEQQSATVDEINNNVMDIQQRYHRANESVGQLANTSASLDKVAARLSGEVSRFIV